MKGLVVKNTGSNYQVCLDEGRLVYSKIKGNFRIKGIRSTNPVAVGDHVEIEENPGGSSFITRIEKRKNYIIRKSANLSKEYHIIASNLDQAFLVVTIKHPETSTNFIDRFLATAEAYNIPTTLVFNKTDLYTPKETEYLDAIVNLYETIGYKCMRISAEKDEGWDDLRKFLKDKITLFSGNSGVGKSTLINKIIPESNLKTGILSEYHDKGIHTTTFSEMIPLKGGGYLIDTPGIKGFGTFDMETSEISHYFPEIFEFSKKCKYNNCTHRSEPGCAVVEAVRNSYISESRYKSYLSILEDENENKYREAQ